MRRRLTLFALATKYALIEHARNRFAMVLVALFIPLWTTLAYLITPDAPVRMRLQATGQMLAPHGNEITEISGALNAVTLITGFMMFAATFAGHDFDRRVTMAGYPRIQLVLAKVAALALASAAVSGYATAVTCLIWSPRQPLLLAVALLSAAMTYGVLGVAIGAVMRREVEGMFAILMTSLVDLTLQNPISSSGSGSAFTRFLPSYGAMQASTAAGFSTTDVPGHVAIQLSWFIAAALMGLLAFHRRTRNALPPVIPPPCAGTSPNGTGRGGQRRYDDGELNLAQSPRPSAGTCLHLEPYMPGKRHRFRLSPHARRSPGSTSADRPVPGQTATKPETDTDADLRAAYRLCGRLTSRHDPATYAVLSLLPLVLRQACWAVFAAVSAVDDLIDDRDAAPAERAARADSWIAALDADLIAGTSTDLIRYALVDTTARWRLDLSGLRESMLESRDDVSGRHIDDWNQWRAWSRGNVAPLFDIFRTLFSRAGVPVIFSLDRQASYEQLVHGARLTDILTDLGADLGEDSSPFLPREILEHFPGAEDDLMRRSRWSTAAAALVSELTGMARQWVTHPGLTQGMHPGPAIAINAMTDLLLAQLDAIQAAGPTLLRREPRPPLVTRARILVPARIRSALAWSLTPLAVPSPNRAGHLKAPVPRQSVPQSSFPTPPPHPSGQQPPKIPAGQMPTHVAVIMDGNGRWATKRGLPRHEGHRVGISDAMQDVIFGAAEIGLSHLSLFLFSTENWKRDYEEVSYLFDTLHDQLRNWVAIYASHGIRIRWAGRTDGLPQELIEELQHAESSTRHLPGLTLTFCFNYGGRAELTVAAARLMRAATTGDLQPDHLSEDDLAGSLLLPDTPDVDLLWRTGGEHRISNFLLWQSAYAELQFTDTYWPDIDRRNLWQAITAYARRERRYGTAPATAPASPDELTAEGNEQ